ncbi:hypothetical protein OVA24_08535 [Luteolibacter sp. SL250]|uniref:hypothetical protein n=1 Tax=Luteolibacter sp. SL250 TaxID=2995170 RepID=UPI0022718472|nr:hypothetical protein [Luteolibacter sp. SL250]WAC21432.1 hypothetical protein OVA24_08535 [Luteolibacter sp. SL250]
MHRLRCIIAVMLAIFIAGPACCCLGMTQPVKQAEHSCCSGKSKEKKESVCSCSTAKHQKLAEKDTPLPALFSATLPPLPGAPVPVLLADRTVSLPPAPVFDTGPPRLRLAVLQRFLI